MQGVVRLIVFCALAMGALGGCGNDDAEQSLPDGAVAKVRDHVITRAAVDRATVGQLAIKHSIASMPPYMPTDVEGCIVDHRGRASGADATRDELRERCEQERERRRAAALELLIRGQWYRLEAKRSGIGVPTDRKPAANAAAHAGVKPAYLRGVTEAYLLQLRLVTPLTTGQSKHSPQQILASYDQRLRSTYGDDTVCAEGQDVPVCG